MNRRLITIVLFSISSASLSDEKMCWVTFNYSGSTNGPGGQGQSLQSTADPFVYGMCKSICYGKLPNYVNIDSTASCTIDGVDIEKSNYKKTYLKNKSQICHVQVVGNSAFNLFLAKDEDECKSNMSNFYWCKNGHECTYTLGEW